jgi:hypothetical protein
MFILIVRIKTSSIHISFENISANDIVSSRNKSSLKNAGSFSSYKNGLQMTEMKMIGRRRRLLLCLLWHCSHVLSPVVVMMCAVFTRSSLAPTAFGLGALLLAK